MRCPHCRGEIPAESQFCGVCGQNIAVSGISGTPAGKSLNTGAGASSPSLFDLPVSKGARLVRTAMILGLNLLLLGGALALTLEYFDKRQRSAQGELSGSGTEVSGSTGASEPGAPLAGSPTENSPASVPAKRANPGQSGSEAGGPGAAKTQALRSDAGPKATRPRSPADPEPTESGSKNSTPTRSGPPDGGLRASPAGRVDAGLAPSSLTPEEEAQRVQVLAAQISLVVKRHQAQLKRCYESASKVTTPDKPIEGRIDVRFSVQPDGSAKSVRTSSNDTGSAALENCLLTLVRSWTFPTSGGEALDFVWPFEFQAPK